MAEIKTVELSVNHLEVGMYVAALDRPWLQTPFLFQGFYLKEQNDVHELRKYCEKVHIDVEKTSADPKLAAKLSRLSGTAVKREKSKRFRFWRWRDDRKEVVEATPVIEDAITATEEMPAAKLTYQKLQTTVVGALDKLRAGGELELPEMQGVVEEMIDSVCRNIDAMAWLVRMKQKDDYTYNHSIASSVFAVVFGRHLGLDKNLLRSVAMGALVVDVGKMKVPTELLSRPGPLTADEKEQVKRHVEWGIEILERTDGVDQHVLEMVANHHERFNGSGYPRALVGSSIPVYGRIAGITDTYDAMTTKRPYAEAISTYDAMRQLIDLSDVEFQSEMVEQFIQAIGIFPAGTLVELNTGEVAVVLHQNRERRLRPKLMMILDREKRPRRHFTVVDLRTVSGNQYEEGSLWITRGLEPGAYGVDPEEFYLG